MFEGMPVLLSIAHQHKSYNCAAAHRHTKQAHRGLWSSSQARANKGAFLTLLPCHEAQLCLTDINTTWAPFIEGFATQWQRITLSRFPRGDAPPKSHPATDPRWRPSLTPRWHARHPDNTTGASRAGVQFNDHCASSLNLGDFAVNASETRARRSVWGKQGLVYSTFDVLKYPYQSLFSSYWSANFFSHLIWQGTGTPPGIGWVLPVILPVFAWDYSALKEQTNNFLDLEMYYDLVWGIPPTHWRQDPCACLHPQFPRWKCEI